MTAYEQDIWTDPSAFSWASRDVCIEALGAVVNNKVTEYLDPEQPTLEIGSGLGALGNLLDGRLPLMCVDGSASANKLHQVNIDAHDRRDEHIAQADLYNLPFASDSVPNAVGLLVLDAVLDADIAFSEVARVLKPGGTFLYFHDTGASHNALSNAIRSDGQTPVPVSDRRFAIMDEPEFKRFSRLAKRAWKNTGLHPELILEDLQTGTDHADKWYMVYPEILEAVSDIIENDKKLAKTISEKTTYLFANYLGLLAEANGMTVLENALRSESRLVDRTDELVAATELDAEANAVLHSAFGARSGFADDVPTDKVLTIAEPLVFVARKN